MMAVMAISDVVARGCSLHPAHLKWQAAGTPKARWHLEADSAACKTSFATSRGFGHGVLATAFSFSVQRCGASAWECCNQVKFEEEMM